MIDGRRNSFVAALLLALISAGCAEHQAKRTDATVAIPTEATRNKLEPVFEISPAMTDLSELRRSEILAIQNVLKPQYRDRLQYTFDTAGTFVVLLASDSGGKSHLFAPALNSCHTPPAGLGDANCVHECSMIFEKQSWEAGTIPGNFGRCIDDSPIWLHPKKPLPNFLAYPPVGG